LQYLSPPAVAIELWLLPRQLPAGIKLVYALIAACTDRETNEAQVSQAALGLMLGMTERHVRLAITRLRGLRLLDWKRAGTGSITNTYMVTQRHPWKSIAPRALTGSRKNSRGRRGRKWAQPSRASRECVNYNTFPVVVKSSVMAHLCRPTPLVIHDGG
jgi:hypothetical protein